VTDATAAAALTRVPHSFLGHPRGLATLFFTEMWERFSYYGMRALLILFMTAAVSQGGLGMSAETAGAVYGLYTAGAYLSALPGGWVADRLIGQRRCAFWGGILISVGNLMLAVPSHIELFYIGLLIVALGTGLLKPNVSCMVGALYQNDTGSRRDAGFSIYYLGINLGAVIAPFVAGTIGETAGYRWGFCSAGVAMIFGLFQYRATAHWLGDAGVEPNPATDAQRRRGWWMFGAGIALIVGVVAAAATGALHVNVLELAGTAGIVMIALAIVFFGSIFLFGHLQPIEKKRVAVIALFLICSAVFWAGYEQAGSTLNLFARDYTDRSFLGSYFAGGQHPTSWYQSVQALYVLIFAPVFAWIWLALGRRNLDPSAPVKFGLGLLQLGLGFAVMMVAAKLVTSSGHPVLPVWLLLTYLLQTTGELCLSPVGLSNVTKLAPARYVGQMMGTWFMGMAIGNLAAGLIGGEVGGGSITDMPVQFFHMALVGGGTGVILLLIARPVRAWLGGVR
jgi:proton-dependent oligopeptide transporter, POT family